MFIDRVILDCRSGKGGDGRLSFLREKTPLLDGLIAQQTKIQHCGEYFHSRHRDCQGQRSIEFLTYQINE